MPIPILLAELSLTLFIGATVTAVAAPSAKPDAHEFTTVCRAHRLGSQDVRITAPEQGTITFLPTLALEGNQDRFSFAAVQNKIKKTLKSEPGAYVDKNKDQWVFNHDQGRSLYPIDSHIRGIFYAGRVYIIDGHHRALISTYLGATTIPVQITADWTQRFTRAEFEDYMDRNYLSYFHDSNGRATPRVDLCEMEDDANLQLARLLLFRVDLSLDQGHLTVNEVKGRKTVIGGKTNDDLAFLEFEVADTLRRAGIDWEDSNDEKLHKHDLNVYLKILKRAAKSEGSRLKQVLLLDKPTAVADLDLKKLILKHFAELDCQNALVRTDATRSQDLDRSLIREIQ